MLVRRREREFRRRRRLPRCFMRRASGAQQPQFADVADAFTRRATRIVLPDARLRFDDISSLFRARA